MEDDPLASAIRGAINGISDVGWRFLDRQRAARDELPPTLPQLRATPSIHPNWFLKAFAEHENGFLLYILAKTSDAVVSNVSVYPSEGSANVVLIGNTEWPGELQQNEILAFQVAKGDPDWLAPPNVTVEWVDFEGESRHQQFDITITGSSILDAMRGL